MRLKGRLTLTQRLYPRIIVLSLAPFVPGVKWSPLAPNCDTIVRGPYRNRNDHTGILQGFRAYPEQGPRKDIKL